MEIPQSLQTIAEISIAFAGFSGLIVALRKNRGALTSLEKFRLQVLLSLSFGAMFLAFLPEILESAGLQGREIWTYAGIVLILYSIVFLAWWIKAARMQGRSFPEVFDWGVFSRMTAGHVLVILLQLACIAALLPDLGATAYFVALVWYLIHAAQQFARMLFVQPNSPEQQNNN